MKSFLAAAIALSILLFPISLASQASKWSPPLTPDGKPDLQGRVAEPERDAPREAERTRRS
jgi:hypothetical protein